ncbi:MAG: hypothetical protein EOP04_14235, partial [Proteobacteria bacterium]
MGEAKKVAEAVTQQVFDLVSETGMRSVLVRISKNEALLVIVFHHIYFDAWSAPIFWKELVHFYNNDRTQILEPLPVQYRDFAEWQHEPKIAALLDQSLEFWKGELEGCPTTIPLRTDGYSKSEGYSGGNHLFSVSEDVSSRVLNMARELNVTPFVIHLTTFAIFLHKHSLAEDLVIGIPVSVRNRSVLQGIIGYFVNSLPVRLNVLDQLSFFDLAQHVKTKFLQSMDHRTVPFERIVEAMRVNRINGTNPLFQIMFSYEDRNEDVSPVFDGINCDFPEVTSTTAKFHLSLDIMFESGKFKAAFNYREDLFELATIEGMATQYVDLLADIVGSPRKTVSEMTMLSPKAKTELIKIERQKKNVHCDFDNFVAAFQDCAKKYPSSAAVRSGNRTLDYRGLDLRSSQLADYLEKQGIQEGSVVAVLMDCSIDLIVSILAILKTGATYLPLNYQAPFNRNQGVLREALVDGLLTDCRSRVGDAELKLLIDSKTDSHLWIDSVPKRTKRTFNPEGIAYIIYTSGSTGKPKGVMISHRALIHQMYGLYEVIGAINEGTPLNILLAADISFDASIDKIILGLTRGNTLDVMPMDKRLNSIDCLKYMKINKINFAEFTPSQANVLIESGLFKQDLPDLVVLSVGGERVNQNLWDHLSGCGLECYNFYGPTECTVNTTFKKIEGLVGKPTIGKSMPGYRTYLVNSFGKLSAIGEPGELCVGGPGLATG